MKIALYTKSIRKEQLQFFKSIFTKLTALNIESVVSEAFIRNHTRNIFVGDPPQNYFQKYEDLIGKEIDFFVSIGGDGTFLDALLYVRDLNIPVLGINIGRLGFLSNNPEENINQVFPDLINKKYHVDERSLINFESNYNIFENESFALNDFTIHKRDNSSLTAITAFLNGEFFNTYWGDGIIVSTPTGSTAYSMSCGGPIVYPDSHNFIITPVAPHNLNVRPLIVPDTTIISFEMRSREKKFLISLDSRYKIVNQNCTIIISKAGFKFKTVRFYHQSFNSILREKLIWGVDNRNK